MLAEIFMLKAEAAARAARSRLDCIAAEGARESLRRLRER